MPLPLTPMTIHGGCNCRAIRYQIRIPEYSSRPIHPWSDQAVRLPYLVICHCNDCRRAVGSLTLAGICNPAAYVHMAFLPLSSPLPPLGPTRLEPPVEDDKLDWLPASEIFPPNNKSNNGSVVVPPPNSFLGAYMASEGVTRTFCKRCGTNITYSRHPMPKEWPEMLAILMGTIDREDLERAELRPERHLWWEKGIDWVQKLFSEGDGGMPKHPSVWLTDVVP